ncbi:hypothetical protein BDV98DRAFT_606257 [Pterulicium gracile]|uniref:Mid2 domain-containing protein n=1 Tax=Pterulicium gracile TaxID=1884261 RepID=A0A5C3QF17_9AGAR|nr:hypothetical protein BDV98DRAFT_606257 [Pterula gracilis]
MSNGDGGILGDILDPILSPILSPLLPDSTDTTSSVEETTTSESLTSEIPESTSSTQSSSSSGSSTDTLIPAPSTTTLSSSILTSSSDSETSTDSQSSTTETTPTPTPTSSVEITTSPNGETVIITVSTTNSEPSASGTAVAAAPNGFLQNKPLAGAVLGVGGFIVLGVLIAIIALAIRRSKRKREHAEAVSFDPAAMIDRHSSDNGHMDDKTSIMEKGRHSGGSSWDSHQPKYGHLFPNAGVHTNAVFYGTGAGYGQGYGNATAPYLGQSAPARALNVPILPPVSGGRLSPTWPSDGGAAPVPPPTPPPPAATPTAAGAYRAAYERSQPRVLTPGSEGTPQVEAPGMSLLITNQ